MVGSPAGAGPTFAPDPAGPARRRPNYIVLHDLSSHTGVGIRHWPEKNKIGLCFIRTCASWANPIEAHFGRCGSPAQRTRHSDRHVVDDPSLQAGSACPLHQRAIPTVSTVARMGDLGIALIAAGAALAGSALTGLFTIAAGRRQAAAARYAGDEQARAVIDTVNRTLDEQRAARIEAARRQVYTQFLMAFDEALHLLRPRNPGSARRSGLEKVNTQHGLVELEGPEAVHLAASVMVEALLDLAEALDNYGGESTPSYGMETRRCAAFRRHFLATTQAVLHGDA